jgi:magnesium transporter
MEKAYKRSLKQVGLPPGSLVYTGERKVEKPRITVTRYDETHFEEKEVKKVDECFPIKGRRGVTWVNIDGLHDVEVIEKIGTHLGIHPLVLEDVLNMNERPKTEDYDDYIFIITKMLYHGKTKNIITTEQVSLILGPNYVVTFQERVGDVFDNIRERLRTGKGRLRKNGADYLAFGLLDAIVDNYFVVLESIGEKIDYFEESVVEKPTTEILHEIHGLRRRLLSMSRVTWAVREVIDSLQRGESELVKDTTKVFLRDIYDHTIQIIDNVETFRDMFSSMLDIYMSSISNRLNQIMKVLTIIATVFMPISFIAAVYGMNFRFMPEYDFPFAYPLVLLLMLTISLIMLTYFKKKKWF